MVALGASPGNAFNTIVKLRSSDGKMQIGKSTSLLRSLPVQSVTVTCGFTAGYLTPLRCSESQRTTNRMLRLWPRP
jgi:hypothetical protein